MLLMGFEPTISASGDLYLKTHNTQNKYPCPWWDSNPRSQQASGPETSRMGAPYIYDISRLRVKTTIYTEDNNRYPPLQIRKHGTVINTIYKHHPVFGVYEIKIRNLCLATYTKICDLRLCIYIYIYTHIHIYIYIF